MSWTLRVGLVVALLGAGAVAAHLLLSRPAESVAALDDEAGEVPRETSARGRTYRDPTGGYRISYPVDFELKAGSEPGRLIRADLSRGRELGAQIRVQWDVEEDLAAFLSRYVERFISEMTSRWGGVIREESRRCGPIGAHEGCRVSLQAQRRDGQRWLFLQYLWSRGDRVIIIQSGARLEHRAAQEPILDAIAESLLLE